MKYFLLCIAISFTNFSNADCKYEGKTYKLHSTITVEKPAKYQRSKEVEHVQLVCTRFSATENRWWVNPKSDLYKQIVYGNND